ncbi:pentapeptide repeat-containing protein [Pseudomonas aeruginosa]|uniref:pentapeptide repeat-containing protein n=1 Tax=Pseudomonas aeruginosa TaxID=287 RepID=UPI0020C73669|nr:pentapeptide repeat-containing protein [Pseudomonas aeruginosa]UTL97951.1 pentapeptide repeat-containing protein [Pseudomonas aeruginosa]
MAAKEHRKERIEDQEFDGEITEGFEQKELIRIFAVGVVFNGVSFKQTILSNCYFRKCKFIRCDFTGAQIKDSNFKGSSFEECQFRYSTWEKTYLDENFLDGCLPPEENLARDLVRSLRVNFAQIGNYEAVNEAASIEVALTGRHLYNAAYSRQAYYRSKPQYKGRGRVSYIAQHARWKTLDLLWGNGESILRVLFAGGVAIFIAAALLVASEKSFGYLESLLICFQAFWGLTERPIPIEFAVALTICRFVLFGLFMAILVKRLSRR